MTNRRHMFKVNALLLALVVLIGLIPLFIHPPGAEFGGTDDKISTILQQDHPDYRLWFQPLWEPPSGEIESLLFALQAAIGAGIMGYVLGYLKGSKNAEKGAENLVHLEKEGVS